jgi:7-keto-8-aminopelargonate synthetase-like enzyme
MGIRVNDVNLSGAILTIEGKRLLNFGSCAYLGLNLDERLKVAAIEAVQRYGPVFSSSAAYTSVSLYAELEEQLARIFDAVAIVPSTTTLAHQAVLPVLVADGDRVLVDALAHSSVHLATQLLIAEGISVAPLPHNDLVALESAVIEASANASRVWYLADGVYSMFGDVAPVRQIVALVDRYPKLHVYFDDAHGFGWRGRHGRGLVLDEVRMHPRMAVAVSLAKSFGSGGAALVFPDELSARRVQLVSATMNFSGPLHPAELGAAVASASIHLSPEIDERQQRLGLQIELARNALRSASLPVASWDATPIWYVTVGSRENAVAVVRGLIDEGFYVNVSFFPAVPMGRAGLRFTQTLYHTDDQILSLVGAIRKVMERFVEPDVAIDLDAMEAQQVVD